MLAYSSKVCKLVSSKTKNNGRFGLAHFERPGHLHKVGPVHIERGNGFAFHSISVNVFRKIHSRVWSHRGRNSGMPKLANLSLGGVTIERILKISTLARSRETTTKKMPLAPQRYDMTPTKDNSKQQKSTQ
jgi:hypothetical protein